MGGDGDDEEGKRTRNKRGSGEGIRGEMNEGEDKGVTHKENLRGRERNRDRKEE